MKLTIIGTGYVGLTTGACLAEVGHEVCCVDNNAAKVEMLRGGGIPIYEPGLEDVVKRNVAAGRLKFTTETSEGVAHGEVVMIAVPTPPQPDGSVDLTYIERVAREIAAVLPENEYRVIVDKSTVPVRTGERVADTIARYSGPGASFDVVSNPEFLREGSAVGDLMKPDRIVVGSNSPRALEVMREVYAPFDAPFMTTDINSAELIKHASNSFLALKISYINAVARVCEVSGADVQLVAEGMGHDQRIGRAFLNAGLGYGGSCFPKDIAAFAAICDNMGVPMPLLREVQQINESQRARFLSRMRDELWLLRDKKIAVWGLSFKANTDDTRESVAVKLIEDLIAEGAEVVASDPQGMEKFKEMDIASKVTLMEHPADTVEGADALVIATEWPEFTREDFAAIQKKMRIPLIFDGRNLLDPRLMSSLGFVYHSVGRARPANAAIGVEMAKSA